MGSVVDNTLGTKIFGDSGEDRAMDAQTHAADAANRTQKDMYESQRADSQAYRDAGQMAVNALHKGTSQWGEFNTDFKASDFEADPGYQFRMAEGAKALERSAAARGGLNSGATLKALTKYGQDVASNEYQNVYNRFNADRDRRFGRLSQLAGIGQQSAGQFMNAGTNYANSVSGNQIGLGNANAAAHISQGNKQSNMFGTAAGFAGAYYGAKK